MAPTKGTFNRVPNVGDDAHCGKHGKVVQVITVSPTYVLRCSHCRYSKIVGNAPMTADVYAAKHAVTRSHVVSIYRSGKLLRTVGEQTRQLVLGDEPDF